MERTRILELQRIFTTRLDALAHVVSIGEAHFPGEEALLSARLAPDMFPFGAQVAFACNQPRGFSQWCAGQAIENLGVEVASLAQARDWIADTKLRVASIAAGDDQLQKTKRVGLGPERYCELVGMRYVNDYLIPNLYFHITAAYAIVRGAGAPIGKADYLQFLGPDVKQEGAGG